MLAIRQDQLERMQDAFRESADERVVAIARHRGLCRHWATRRIAEWRALGFSSPDDLRERMRIELVLEDATHSEDCATVRAILGEVDLSASVRIDEALEEIVVSGLADAGTVA